MRERTTAPSARPRPSRREPDPGCARPDGFCARLSNPPSARFASESQRLPCRCHAAPPERTAGPQSSRPGRSGRPPAPDACGSSAAPAAPQSRPPHRQDGAPTDESAAGPACPPFPSAVEYIPSKCPRPLLLSPIISIVQPGRAAVSAAPFAYLLLREGPHDGGGMAHPHMNPTIHPHRQVGENPPPSQIRNHAPSPYPPLPHMAAGPRPAHGRPQSQSGLTRATKTAGTLLISHIQPVA